MFENLTVGEQVAMYDVLPYYEGEEKTLEQYLAEYPPDIALQHALVAAMGRERWNVEYINERGGAQLPLTCADVIRARFTIEGKPMNQRTPGEFYGRVMELREQQYLEWGRECLEQEL